MKKLTLQDLTKEELIAIITERQFFTVTERDIWWVHWQHLEQKAKQKREEALAIWRGASTLYQYTKLWDEAERIQKQAEEFHKQREAYQ